MEPWILPSNKNPSFVTFSSRGMDQYSSIHVKASLSVTTNPRWHSANDKSQLWTMVVEDPWSDYFTARASGCITVTYIFHTYMHPLNIKTFSWSLHTENSSGSAVLTHNTPSLQDDNSAVDWTKFACFTHFFTLAFASSGSTPPQFLSDVSAGRILNPHTSLVLGTHWCHLKQSSGALELLYITK